MPHRIHYPHNDQESCLKSGGMFFPYIIYDNNAFVNKTLVWSHLYRDGIMQRYKIWCYHWESDTYHVGTSSENVPDRVEESTFAEEAVGTVQMVHNFLNAS